MYQCQPGIGGETLRAVAQGIRILIEAEDTAVRVEAREQRRSVSSTAECTVHIDAIGACEHEVDGPIPEHRYVIRAILIVRTHRPPITCAAASSIGCCSRCLV